jgi:ferredoxin
MANQPLTAHDQVILECSHLQALLDNLKQRGYRILGPTRRDGAIVYAELSSLGELPAGWTDRQDGGSYSLEPREDGALFGYSNGPQCWKKFLMPPALRLWHAQRNNGTFKIIPDPPDTPQYAFLGVRPCDLAAMGIQDSVFMTGAFADPGYRARREKAFLIVANCTRAGGTCFCASMQTGPRAKAGFDLALTEVVSREQHYFVTEVGTPAGREVVRDLHCRPASEVESQAAESAVQQASDQMGRHLDTAGLKEMLYRNYEHARWDNVAVRCLTCANCTMVCPTCFCTTIEDTTDLKGEAAERWRKWDSCFTTEFSYIHGGSIRSTPRARYRQWMIHKLAGFIDQFGASGCVGCGRCITWCPVGIDITAEAQAIRESEASTITHKGNSHGES